MQAGDTDEIVLCFCWLSVYIYIYIYIYMNILFVVQNFIIALKKIIFIDQEEK